MTTPWWAFFLLGAAASLEFRNTMERGRYKTGLCLLVIGIVWDVCGVVAIFHGGSLW